MNDDAYVYNAIDYLSAALDQNKKEKMKSAALDELFGVTYPKEGEWRLCPRTASLEVYHNGQWMVP